MSITDETLDRLNQHWALAAVGPAALRRAHAIAEYRLVRRSLGQQIAITFDERPDDSDLLDRVATAFEIAAVEGIDALLYPAPSTAAAEADVLRDQAQAGAYRAYEMRRGLALPADNAERVFEVLHLAALAYAGDRWTDLRRWLREEPAHVRVPSVADVAWDARILYRVFDCWVRLFRKNRWNDLDGIHGIIAGLREDQKQYEMKLLTTEDDRDTHAVALRLVALYHWAKATEVLAFYVIQGKPRSVTTELDQHFEAGRRAAAASGDAALEVILRWLHVASRRMVTASVWWVAHAVNSRVTRFVDRVTKAKCMFELLPPQQAALQEQGLLDQATKAVVVNLPTSGGKTVLAQFRILQALNQFDADHGWVAYVAPTRALVAQITRRLRKDFEPLNVHVEQLTSAVEIDTFEETLLTSDDPRESFHVLVATPEKMSLVIRNKKIARPLALVVLDEAHNIEDPDRGLRIELLLATIKRDCPGANFLLLMPNVPNAQDLATWLAPESGKTISMGSSAWMPNERVVGLYHVEQHDGKAGDWVMQFQALTTTPKAIHLKGRHRVGTVRPLNTTYSKAKSLSNQTGAMARVMSERGTSIAVARKISDVWSMARLVADSMPAVEPRDPDIELVQRFLATEISPKFELIGMLDKGVAVHHAGLSEETKSLIEWLAEEGKLKVLCATTTVAQGINFPVSSVFLSSLFIPNKRGDKMSRRAFWNLAGRAGRIDHDSVGVVGIAGGGKPEEIGAYVSSATEALISRLVSMLDQIEQSQLGQLELLIEREEWTDFRSYIAHLWNEKKDLDALLAESEQILRNTYGYGSLRGSTNPATRQKAKALLEATKRYATKISQYPVNVTLADSTGFSPEGVRAALLGLGGLERKLKPSDWRAASLFGKEASALPQLIGVMMNIPQIRNALQEIGGSGVAQKYIADIARAWVSGQPLETIAQTYFLSEKKPDLTNAITDACKGIYRTLANVGTWGLSALSKMPTSGLDFEKLSDEDKRMVNVLPAMLYHGVSTESAVLMRINSVPRTIAPQLGTQYAEAAGDAAKLGNTRHAREFLRQLSGKEWDRAVPSGATMSGEDYRQVWRRLSGDA